MTMLHILTGLVFRQFFWGFRDIPRWSPLSGVLLAFLGILPTTLWILYRFSLTHTWVVPIFSVGLGVPRWCQVSHYIPLDVQQDFCADRRTACCRCFGPQVESGFIFRGQVSQAAMCLWAYGCGKAVCSIELLTPVDSRCAFHRLGVLDAIQGVGTGIMLLQTLSRIYVAAALFLLQVIGATTVIIAHATAPHSKYR